MENSKQLKKLANSVRLTEEAVKEIIVKDHELKHFYKKSDLKKIDLDIKPKVLKQLTKISSKLKVSSDAVITVLLLKYL